MITEWLMSIGAGMSGWIASLFPTDWEPPEFLAELDTMVNDVIGTVDGLAVWADWGFILSVVVLVLGVWVIGLTVKVGRAIAAHLPIVGGSG